MVSWHGLGIDLIIVLASRIVNPLYAKIRVINESIVTNTRQQLEGMRLFGLLIKVSVN